MIYYQTMSGDFFMSTSFTERQGKVRAIFLGFVAGFEEERLTFQWSALGIKKSRRKKGRRRLCF